MGLCISPLPFGNSVIRFVLNIIMCWHTYQWYIYRILLFCLKQFGCPLVVVAQLLEQLCVKPSGLGLDPQWQPDIFKFKLFKKKKEKKKMKYKSGTKVESPFLLTLWRTGESMYSKNNNKLLAYFVRNFEVKGKLSIQLFFGGASDGISKTPFLMILL